MSAQTGQVLGGRYRLTDCIAVGGMGEVWRARDDVLAREVAVKVLKREYARNEDFLTRFRHEARHSAALTHPNIASVYDYGESEGSAYLVMELVPGEPLNEILAQEGPLPPARAMDLLAQTARGLAAAHKAGVVHRDVKPGNLLVTPDGRVKITDFGIARAADQVPLTKTGQVMGTAQYLPPEQAMGRPATPASDIYSLGVVGYEALTGSLPFTAESPVAIAMAHINADPPPLPPSLPAGARSLIESAMAKDPADRPASAAVFADAAQAVADGRDDVATQLVSVPVHAAATQATRVAPRPAAADVTPATSEPARSGRPRRRMTGPLWALVALLAFVIVGGLLASGVFGGGGAGQEPLPSVTPSVTTPGTTAPSTSSSPSRPTTSSSSSTTSQQGVVVSAGDYVGRDRAAVAGELRALGLTVTEQPDKSSDEPKGTVLSVSPTGDLRRGDRVSVVYSDGSGAGQTSTSTSTKTATPTTSPSPTPTESDGSSSTENPGAGNAGGSPGASNPGGGKGEPGVEAEAPGQPGGGEQHRDGEAARGGNNGGTAAASHAAVGRGGSATSARAEGTAAGHPLGVSDEMKDSW